MSLSRFHSVYSHLNARECILLIPGSEMEREEVPQAPEQEFSCSLWRRPWWSRVLPCSLWRTPQILQLLSLFSGLQPHVESCKVPNFCFHTLQYILILHFSRWYYSILPHSVFFFTGGKIRNTGILHTPRHFYRNKCLYNFCIHKLVISIQAHSDCWAF